MRFVANRTVSLVTWAALLTAETGLARDWVKVNFDSIVREHCHVVLFPLGWQTIPFVKNQLGDEQLVGKFKFGGADFEFRVPGLLGTKFLVRGFIPSLYYFTADHRTHTTNLYTVDLSDPKGLAQPASEAEWDSAALVPFRYTAPADAISKFIQSRGFQLAASGDHGEVDRLSPDRAVVVMQSWKGTLGGSLGSDVPGDISIHWPLGNSHGKLYFDVYSTDTGKKLVTVSANFSIILPEDAFKQTGWLTERYFLIPLDDAMTRCLVCEFGRNR